MNTALNFNYFDDMVDNLSEDVQELFDNVELYAVPNVEFVRELISKHNLKVHSSGECWIMLLIGQDTTELDEAINNSEAGFPCYGCCVKHSDYL